MDVTLADVASKNTRLGLSHLPEPQENGFVTEEDASIWGNSPTFIGNRCKEMDYELMPQDTTQLGHSSDGLCRSGLAVGRMSVGRQGGQDADQSGLPDLQTRNTHSADHRPRVYDVRMPIL